MTNKASYVVMSIIVLAFFISGIFMRRKSSGGSTSFVHSITSSTWVMDVTYDPDRSLQVEKYIDSCLQPAMVFGDRHTANKDVRVSERQLHYHIEGEPGTLHMTAEKSNNSESSLAKIKEIFEGLKSVVKSS